MGLESLRAAPEVCRSGFSIRFRVGGLGFRVGGFQNGPLK